MQVNGKLISKYLFHLSWNALKFKFCLENQQKRDLEKYLKISIICLTFNLPFTCNLLAKFLEIFQNLCRLRDFSSQLFFLSNQNNFFYLADLFLFFFCVFWLKSETLPDISMARCCIFDISFLWSLDDFVSSALSHWKIMKTDLFWNFGLFWLIKKNKKKSSKITNFSI